MLAKLIASQMKLSQSCVWTNDAKYFFKKKSTDFIRELKEIKLM